MSFLQQCACDNYGFWPCAKFLELALFNLEMKGECLDADRILAEVALIIFL